MTTDERRQQWRDAKARPLAGLVRVLAPCGTPAAYRRHRRRGEDCATCRAAEAAAKQVRRNR